VAQVYFYGNAIELYGTTSRAYGLFSISLDSGPATRYNGSTLNSALFNTQQLLYYASNLPGGMHTLLLMNLEDEYLTDLDHVGFSYIHSGHD
jgi:hypothetical protein